jgi:hypothetical protein
MNEVDWIIDLENGKYKLIHYIDAGLVALRYGEPWRKLTGDNLIYFLGLKIIELNEEIENLKSEAEKYHDLSYSQDKLKSESDICDTDRINFLQRIFVDDGKYTGKCILRKSSRGRGYRLHETSADQGSTDVRQVIDRLMRLYK